MKRNHRLTQIWAGVAVLALAILACTPNGPDVVTTQQSPPPTPGGGDQGGISRADLIAATVQIFGSMIENGDIIPVYVGSGSIISRDGLILTNAHVASPASQGSPEGDPDVLVVGIIQSEDQPPVYAYQAEVAAVDGYMDLAVIRITATLDGDSIDPSSLNLPYVPLGDSDDVHVGDHINIFGFPLIGGNTITYTDGNVSGFSPEDQLGDRAWIKTDATISGGNSGGMAASDDGRLIGVPTIAASGADTEMTDCRVVQDTNGDGRVDQNDSCIPIGGFINGLRPVNLALPLIQAAKSGQAYSSPYGGGLQGGTTGSGNERFGPVFWVEVTGVGPCEVGDELGSYPSGTLGLAPGFEYSGMTNGELWAEVWTLDGQKVFESAYEWEEGPSGTYIDCLTNGGDPMPEGSYHVEFYAGGEGGDLPMLSQGDVEVGTGQVPNPPGPQSGIQLSGTVYDQNSENAIEGAYVVILYSGVTYADWSGAGYPDADVYTYDQTDSVGTYTLPDSLERNTPYTLVAFAEGYLDSYGDNLVWSDEEPADFTIDIPLTQ